MRTYIKKTCRCGKEISTAGTAVFHHMMAHVRKGEAQAWQSKCSGLDPRDNHRDQWSFKWLKAPAKFKAKAPRKRTHPIFDDCPVAGKHDQQPEEKDADQRG